MIDILTIKEILEQEYSYVGDVCAIVICIFNMVLLLSTYSIKSKNLTLFKFMNLLMSIGAISSILFNVVQNNVTESNRVFVYLTYNARYVCWALVFVMLVLYIRNLTEISSKRKSKRFDAFVWAFFAIFLIIKLTSPITKFGFHIDENLNVIRNYYFDPFTFYYFTFAVTMNVMIIRNREKLITKVRRCLQTVSFLVLMLIIFQMVLKMTSYTCISFTFYLIAILFLFHYNSYDTETGTLNYRSFIDYVKEAGTSDFTVVWIHIKDMNVRKFEGLSEYFYHFSEKYFKDQCTFKITDDTIVLAYKNKKNSDGQEKLVMLSNDFYRMYEKYFLEYCIVYVESDVRLLGGEEYLAFSKFVEVDMTMNTYYITKKRDIDRYLDSVYIFNELRDINLKQDLNDERIKVFCQPVLNTRTNTYSTAEALMRIVLPVKGMIFPDQFIPVAEKHGYIHTLSKIILNKTCKSIKVLEKDGFKIDRVSVNFSIVELRNPDFCDNVIKIIRSNGISFDKIAIELTESRNEEDFELVKSVMTKLQNLGIKFYLDDFGTGYSSFERIIDLPIDIIKFDRTLTIMAGKGSQSKYLVGSFSDIFKNSNYQIMFEGIEDDTDEELCKEMNAQYLQGFKYSRPIPIERLTEFLVRKEG